MARIPTSLGLAAVFALAASTAHAHHNTGALFDLDAEITLEGVVTAYEWANPHVYFFVAADDPAGDSGVWEIEAGALAMMRRLGWSSETLAAGDRVVVNVNPSRDAGRKEGFLVSAEKTGAALPASRGEEAFAALTESGGAPATAVDGLSGTWVTLLEPTVLELLEEPASLSLTAQGTAAIEDFDEASMHPGIDCIPFTAPLLMVAPDIKSIEVGETAIRIRGEFDAAVRTIHMTAAADNSDAVEFSLQGFSTGRFEGDVLVVETVRFFEHRMGNAYSLPSGAEKRLVERLEMNPDRTGLTYRFELEDPQYLAAPVTGEVQWAYRPDLEFSALECDRDNASRFLSD